MRVILVTGANGGLGQAISRDFLNESKENFVWLGVRKAIDKAATLASEFPERCSPVGLDVTNPSNWQSALKTILARQGRIDVLVNNAGRHRDGLLANLDTAAWDEVLSLNLDGVFHGCRAVLSSMISQRHGRIINISS